jgi:hypothetical protein
LEDRCEEQVEANLAGDKRTTFLRVGVGRHRTPRINVSGGARQSADRIANFALRIAASGNLPQGVTDGLADACAVGPDFAGEIRDCAGVYAFGLACLMNEVEQSKAFACAR